MNGTGCGSIEVIRLYFSFAIQNYLSEWYVYIEEKNYLYQIYFYEKNGSQQMVVQPIS